VPCAEACAVGAGVRFAGSDVDALGHLPVIELVGTAVAAHLLLAVNWPTKRVASYVKISIKTSK